MIAAFLAAALSASSPQAPTEEEARRDVSAVLDRLHQTAAAGDGATYFSLFTPEARYVGTDATEHWTLPEFQEFARQYFSRGRGWTYQWRDRTVTIAPIECRCVAWFDEKLHNVAFGDTRGSGVLRLTDDGWKIEQYVLSMSVPNDKARAVVALTRGDQAAQ